MNAEEIKKIIPHREPFLMIDEAEIIEKGRSAEGLKKITGDESFLRGHFPDEPVMPGVLIIEAMAQLGAVLALSGPANSGKKIYFTSIENARFRKKVKPGDQLKLRVEFISFRHSIGKGHAEVSVDGSVVCSADLGFALGD